MQQAHPGAVKVDRSTKWGNPFKVGDPASGMTRGPVIRSNAMAVELFRAAILARRWGLVDFGPGEIAQLRGHDLACWCKLGEPCHADVLLELANRPLGAVE